MGADRCLDCGYLHSPGTAKVCLVCGSSYLILGSDGDLDAAWMAHRAGFPEGTPQSRIAWGELAASVITGARVDRALWRDFGWYHVLLTPGGLVTSVLRVQYDLCSWG